jgi:FkbM family methyltransferase
MAPFNAREFRVAMCRSSNILGNRRRRPSSGHRACSGSAAGCANIAISPVVTNRHEASMNRNVGLLRWLIRQVFRGAIVPLPGEANTVLWSRPSEYPSLLLGPRRIEAEIAREWAVLLRAGEVIFDIGANIGFTVQRFYALLGGRCRIWAFEPMPRNLELLERNVSRLRGTTTIVRSAVGDRDGSVRLSDNLHHGGLSRLDSLGPILPRDASFWKTSNEIDVPILTLDTFMAESSDLRPSFIKVDVEGAGYLVINGARQVLAQHKPVISCSFHSDEEQYGVLGVLEEHGYGGVVIGLDGTCRWCDLRASTGNYVHPEDERARGFGPNSGETNSSLHPGA